ncbi:mitochondrial 37S ribosomal bS18m domain-containing protein [Lipomyces oligophaga]|uniref:mitochondrial 37S ribosomal bS18m domain-containing protein n=1 Tax=Lipomyces oligophaga TaxID=45792 RepID=UPI0034CEFA6F
MISRMSIISRLGLSPVVMRSVRVCRFSSSVIGRYAEQDGDRKNVKNDNSRSAPKISSRSKQNQRSNSGSGPNSGQNARSSSRLNQRANSREARPKGPVPMESRKFGRSTRQTAAATAPVLGGSSNTPLQIQLPHRYTTTGNSFRLLRELEDAGVVTRDEARQIIDETEHQSDRIFYAIPPRPAGVEEAEEYQALTNRTAGSVLRTSFNDYGEVWLPKDLSTVRPRKYDQPAEFEIGDRIKLAGIDPVGFYRDPLLLSPFITSAGLIKKRDTVNDVSPKNFRKIAKAVRRARASGLLSPNHRAVPHL